MGVISTRTHGIIDYVFGLLLIVSPYLFDFADGGPAQLVAQVIGAAILLMSLITNYEYSILKIVPMPLHLAIDLAGGFVLLASPWIFGFAEAVYVPHVILGLIEIATSLMTPWSPRIASAVRR